MILANDTFDQQRVGLLAVLQGDGVVQARIVLPSIGDGRMWLKQIFRRVGSIISVGGYLRAPALVHAKLVEIRTSQLHAQVRLEMRRHAQPIPLFVHFVVSEGCHQLADFGSAVVANEIHAAIDKPVTDGFRAS